MDNLSAQIYKIHSDFYYVNYQKNSFECKIREVLKKQRTKIVVGDFVELAQVDDDKKTAVVTKILPRKNSINRPSVSNIDQIVIISAVKEPDLDFAQLNRYIALAKYHGIETKLCFNKEDLEYDDSMVERIFSIYEPLGFDIIFTSALEKIGLEDFLEILEGKTSVFCGNSGVGKSTLINSIDSSLNIKTKQVSEKTSRGVHTTRHCEIIDVKDKNIRIIDTPGFSNVKFDFILPTQVDELFDEIFVFKHKCKFKDCLHVQELGCEVLLNLDKIDPTRYESYLAFVEEAREFKEKIKFQGLKKETSQKQVANKSTLKISSRARASARNTLKQRDKEVDFE